MQNAPREHSAILSTFIQLPFVFNTFVLSAFVWPLKTGFTVFFNLLGPREFSIKFDTVKPGWSIVYIEWSQVIISKKYCISLFLKADFLLANSADPDEMPHYAAFHLDLHCLSMYLCRGFWFANG